MNVVTIDFDIIMGPTIEQYNDEIFDTKPIDNLPNNNAYIANLYIYQKLTLFLMEIIQTLPPEKVIFIMDHEEVLNCLQNVNESIDLINIDHHHDLGYKNKAYELNLVSCSNWAKLLCEKQSVNSYTWINNDTTICYPMENELKYLSQSINIQSIIEKLNTYINNVDMLIICASFNWVPPQYRNLFFLWKELIEYYYKKQILLIDNSSNFIEIK